MTSGFIFLTLEKKWRFQARTYLIIQAGTGAKAPLSKNLHKHPL